MAAPSLAWLRDACPQGPRHPGRSTAPYPGEGGLAPCRSPGPCSGGGGGDILLGLLASSTAAPPAAPGEEGGLARPGQGRGSWGGGRQGGRRALRLLCRRPGSQLCGLRQRGSLDHLSPPSLASSPLPSPARTGRRKPGLHLPARRVRPAPGLAQTPAARLSASGHALQPLSGLAPSPRSPRIPGPTSALPTGYPPPLLFPTHPPSLCSRLWGWARDVKPSVASARLAGAGHQKSNVLFPNYPLSVREQGRTGWELNVKYPLQAGSITPGIQPQPPTPLCQLQTTQTKSLRDLLFLQGVGRRWGWAGLGGLSIAVQPDTVLLIKTNNAPPQVLCVIGEAPHRTGRPRSHKYFPFVF